MLMLSGCVFAVLNADVFGGYSLSTLLVGAQLINSSLFNRMS